MTAVRPLRRLAEVALGLLALAGAAAAASAQSSPSPYTSATRYDVTGRVTGTIAPDPDGAGPLKHAATRTTYDTAGRPIKVETGELAAWQSEAIAPANWTGFTLLSSVETGFDAMDRKILTIVKGSGGGVTGVTQLSYDAIGRLECTAVRMNPAAYASLPASACTLGAEGSEGPDRITRNVHDVAGQLLKIQRAFGTPLVQDYATYSYSANGKQLSVKDANGNLATMAYDGHDRQVRWNFPSKTVTGGVSATDYEEYGYDANGSRTSLRKRDGSILTYQYDALNRNIAKIVPERAGLGTNHSRDVYYGYDLRGLQISARYDSASGDGVVTAYDGFGRLGGSAITLYGTSFALAYAHDKNGNRTRITHPDGVAFDYAYDGLNRATGIAQGGTPVATLAYNNRATRASLSVGAATSYSYDPAGRLNALTHDLGAAATADDVSYGLTYNPASQLAGRTTSNDAYAYTAEFDVERNYAVNGLNQYQTAGPATFCYDANGNLTADGSNAYLYDIENRLVEVRAQVGSACPVADYSGASKAVLRYDPLGRLYMFGGIATPPSLRFVYDGDALIAEVSQVTPNPILRRYVHGPGIDEPLVWYEGAGVAIPRFLRANWQGSVVAVVNNSGAALARNAYDEWGIPAAANLGRFQYTGQIWLPDAGVYYYKARVYSPTLGRFLQTDPIGYEDQVNLYAYVGNDPVNLVDPTGQRGSAATVISACVRSPRLCAIVAAGGALIVSSLTLVNKRREEIRNGPPRFGIPPPPVRPVLQENEGEKPTAPPANNGYSKPHGAPDHDAAVDADIQEMRDKGYSDIRKNQVQVDAQGNRVGNNKPDSQGTDPDGTREIREQDRDPRRSKKHGEKIQKNDPKAKCVLSILC